MSVDKKWILGILYFFQSKKSNNSREALLFAKPLILFGAIAQCVHNIFSVTKCDKNFPTFPIYPNFISRKKMEWTDGSDGSKAK